MFLDSSISLAGSAVLIYLPFVLLMIAAIAAEPAVSLHLCLRVPRTALCNFHFAGFLCRHGPWHGPWSASSSPSFDSMTASSSCPARFQAARRVLANELSRHGFDICHYFLPQWYNDSIFADGVSVLPHLPNPSPTTAFLVGNTKRMWPIFIDWVEDWKKLEGGDTILKSDPLDKYTMESIGKVVEENKWRFVSDHHESAGEPSSDIFWSSDTRENRLISMQRLASVSGLCYLDEASNMAIHPTFGPWLSFRAAIMLFHVGGVDIGGEGEHSMQSLPMPVAKLLRKSEEMNARKFVEKAFDKNTPKDDATKCLIAARDSVDLGRDEHRFSDAQLMYHYTKDIKYLYL